jgi:large subunit ribosomal protein L29
MIVKVSELKNLSREELKQKETTLNQEIFNLKFQKATGQLGNTAIIGKNKKELARVKTILKEMEISGEVEKG